MSDKIVVRFLKAWRGYSADELAGFDPDVVEGLKVKGFAEVYEGGGAASRPKATKTSTGKPRASKPSDKPDGNGDGGTGDGGSGGAEGAGAAAGGEGESTESADDEEKP